MSINTDFTPIFRSGSSIDTVRSRIHYKMRDYATYRFTAPQSCALNIFFDLAQEFDDLDQLHMLSVLILRMFFQYEAELYLKDSEGKIILVTPAIDPDAGPLPELRSEIWSDNSRCYIPVRGRNALMVTRNQRIVTDQDLMGVLVLHINRLFASHDLLFLEKFANRVGFCLHNKILAQRNSRHIIFLRKLAHDIGHNIITPNMRLKLLLNHLQGQVETLGELCKEPLDDTGFLELRIMQRKMAEQISNVMGTFLNSALFMESLLRQSHFDLGHYVLRRVRLDVCSLVVGPQFERYRSHLVERNLYIDERQPEYPDCPCMVMADLGLISQVLANFLSNAVKYTPALYNGQPGEVRCKVEVVSSAFGRGMDGAKVMLFNSGDHIPADEAARLFEDNYRASNSSGQYGTGHGLFFVREIVAEHGGVTGYEPAPGGNCFYFILPVTE